MAVELQVRARALANMRDDDPEKRLTRRALEKAALAGGASLLAGCPSPSAAPLPISAPCAAQAGPDVDYIVVGSGAGGGPLACNLARAGFKVLLLEAGGETTSATRDIPAMHAAAVEDPAIAWDFYARTYSDEGRQSRNEKCVPSKGGVLYPRASTLGGCTEHNALITIYPHNADWDAMATALSDPSWSAEAMRKYFQRLEHCDYTPAPAEGAANPSRHGYRGWLHTDVANPWLGVGDRRLVGIIDAVIEEASESNPYALVEALGMALSRDQALWDPNDWRFVEKGPEGIFFVPLHVNNGTRSGPRDYVRAVAAACPSNLTVVLDALCCRVLFDADNRATGVEYLSGRHLYRASPLADAASDPGERHTALAKREVILCGGVFNSPQLLLLSGIGPRADLESHGIPLRVDLPGVGKNLQDRYEIGVVSEMDRDFAVLAGTTFDLQAVPADARLHEWHEQRTGPYATNGVVCTLIKRSRADVPVPDLFLFGLVGCFKGYYRGYSRDLVAGRRHFTWGILKGHTHNTAGEVGLQSTDPRDPPRIDFHYFDEGSPGHEQDLQAVVEGVLTARRIMASLGNAVEREVFPGPEIATRAQIAQLVRDQAWGHHASCTNKMGLASDPMAVVDSRFRVHGTKGLRVVDASIFPRIPGFFIVTSVYMIAEKASDVILEDARAQPAQAASMNTPVRHTR